MILGILSGFVGAVMMRTLFFAEGFADRVQRTLLIPDWLRPAVAGAILGVIALQFPHIIGVGYETTSLALTTQIACRAHGRRCVLARRDAGRADRGRVR
jgi:CIC family chloride channel protein